MTVEISGFCEERFAPLKEAFRSNFDDGLELGASLALTHGGRMVVDLWAGWANPRQTRPWEKDTIVCVFSTTKIMVTMATLMLVDRGLIELDAPVARYWPEFGQGGKEAVTVRDALIHQAGVPGFSPPVSFEALNDWAAITALLAATPHWFEGERVLCYHELTFGFLLGELIRRVDGRRPAQFFHEELAVKAGADFQFGLTSKSEMSRLASLRHPSLGLESVPDELFVRVHNSVGQGDLTSWEHLNADIPASNGYGNGRSIARLCAILAMGGELDGVRYLSGSMVEEAAREQVCSDDSKFGLMRFGLGFGLDHPVFPAPSPSSLHWGGYGGSWGLMDPKAGVSLGYAPNNMIIDFEALQDPRLQRFSDALEKLLPQL